MLYLLAGISVHAHSGPGQGPQANRGLGLAQNGGLAGSSGQGHDCNLVLNNNRLGMCVCWVVYPR